MTDVEMSEMDRVLQLNDKAFEAFVKAEARGRIDRTNWEVLTHPKVVGRYEAALVAIMETVDLRLTELRENYRHAALTLAPADLAEFVLEQQTVRNRMTALKRVVQRRRSEVRALQRERNREWATADRLISAITQHRNRRHGSGIHDDIDEKLWKHLEAFPPGASDEDQEGGLTGVDPVW